jgi:hypothetical protein
MAIPLQRYDVIAPAWGGPLNQTDYAKLAASWITPDIADAALLRRVAHLDGRDIVGQKGKRDCAGILFSYYRPGEPAAYAHRIRRDNPEWTEKAGKLKPLAKYLAAPGSANRLYIAPGITVEHLQDPAIPIALVEGEKKALALWRLAHHATDRVRFIPVGIPGVWNWRGVIGKTGGPNGERLPVKGPIADLDWILWDRRTAFIIFDANVHTNDSVKWARNGISRELTRRGSDVKLVSLPEDCGVNGVDDLLASWGPDRVSALFDTAVYGGRLHVVIPPQFQATPDGMFRITSRGNVQSKIQLTNFCAAIVTNIKTDDGVETSREFEIEAELFGQRHRFTIPAAEFAAMNWHLERLGAAAIVFTNQRGYAQTAIQSLSLTATEKCIYTHTGWREVDGNWIYLHAGGAVGPSGAISHMEVRLPGAVERYELRLPTSPTALRLAVSASLKLLELAPPAVSFPLYAGLCRSIFGDADFSLHLVGESGAFKSELAALYQQHFGAEMNRLHLPGAWSSTGNALEALAFHAKDALFVIDDFAPQGSIPDVNRLHSAAERVFRAAGNHAGRTRLDSTAKLRLAKPPRALILSTGEDIPRGQSLRARLLVLELAKGEIDGHRLSLCQRDAADGRYAEALAGMVQWIAGRYENTRASFATRFAEHRAKALVSAIHARTPDIVANLQAAFELYMEYAVAVGVITATEADKLADRCWDALRQAAMQQSKHQGEAEPTARFLTLLRSVLASGRAHLEHRSGGEPDQSPESCGWRRDSSGQLRSYGECIGWIDGDDLYLEPSAAFRAVQIAARDSSEGFAISEQILKKRLSEKKLLASVDEQRETLTVRRRICGSSKTVLHLQRGTLLPETPDDVPEDAA